ncbi:MAG: TonB-dependent receptor, partial [Bacteroidota bacterium]
GQDQQTTRQEDVYVYTLNLDFQKALDTLQRLQYGLEVTHNDVHSEAYEMNINTRVRQPASTRYPDGGSYMQSGAVYLSYKRFFGDKIVAHAGGRASYVRLESTFEDTTFYRLPFTSIGFNTGALTGSLGAVYTPTDQWHVSAVLSSGYRVPNVDDVGKIFDNGTNVVVPNDGIRPEFAYNAEAAVTRRFWNDRVTVSGNAFVTFLRQVIVRREHQLNGQDSLVYEGELLNIQTNVNASRGTIWGYSLSGKVRLLKPLTLEGSFNYTYGEDRTDDVPLGHIPPTFGRIALDYRSGKLQASAYAFYNGWKRIEDMSPSGVDNEDEATADGFPSWYTLNVNTSYAVTPHISVQAALENILDVHYRPFASGLSAAGRNFRFTLRARI